MNEISIFRKFIKTKLHRGKKDLVKGAKNGFFHIIGGNVFVKVFSALSVLMFPRIMGNDYGTFKLADNLFGYLLIINGFGMTNVILRYCAAFDTPREQKSYFNFAVKFGLVSDIGIIAVFCGILYIPELFGVEMIKFGAGGIVAMMLLIAFFDFLFSAAQSFLRTNRENKKFAKTAFIFSALYALIPLLLSVVFGFSKHSMEGAVIGRYIAYAVTLIIIFKMLRTLPAFREKPINIRRSEKIDIVKYSFNSLMANVFSYIMPYNENIVLSVMVTKSLFSDFQVAQLLPQSIQYLATSVIIYVYPYFAKNYLDGKWIYKNTKKVVLGMSALMGVIALIGIVFSPQIVLIFGSRFKTDSAVRLMRVLFITFAVNSAVRMPVCNILAAIGEVRFNVANAIFSCTVHLGICWALISTFGIGGAAYGLLIGYIISSVAAVIYLKYYCKKLEYRKNDSTVEPVDENI